LAANDLDPSANVPQSIRSLYDEAILDEFPPHKCGKPCENLTKVYSQEWIQKYIDMR